jgi:hypothetical protein
VTDEEIMLRTEKAYWKHAQRNRVIWKAYLNVRRCEFTERWDDAQRRLSRAKAFADKALDNALQVIATVKRLTT